MTIKVGDSVPAGKLWEFVEEETPGCSIGPNEFDVAELVKGKRIALFALPGAFTPTCSAQHVPSFVKHADDLKAKGVELLLRRSKTDQSGRGHIKAIAYGGRWDVVDDN